MQQAAKHDTLPTVVVEAPPMTAKDIQMQVNTIQQVLEQVMQKDVHYGVIPGCKEPSLYKPGAEKILATFRLSVDPEVTDLSTTDEIRYRVKVTLKSASGNFVGAGIGECSTDEEKYKWRTTYIEEEFEDTDDSRKRIKYTKYKSQPTKKVQQIRTNPSDLANTVLKMAKKRAMIDATLTATAASDIFTQDIEDMPDELQGAVVEQRGMAKNHTAKTELSKEAKELIPLLEKEAKNGWESLQAYWATLSPEQRDEVGADFGRIKKIAEGV